MGNSVDSGIMSWLWPEGFYTFLMIAVFVGAAFYFKLPVAVAMLFSAIAGALAAGNGIALRHLVEGEFGYLDTIMVIATAMIFMKTIQKTGFLDAFSVWIIRRFRHVPVLLSLGIMFLIMAPGMITGSSIASVLTTGALVAPVLVTLGVESEKAGAVIAMGALLGMVAPPVSIPTMMICAGVDIPYVGFTIPLLVCTVPLAVLFAGFIIYPQIRHFNDEAALEQQLEKMSTQRMTFRLSLPIVTLVVLIAAEQFLVGSKYWHFLGMPGIFLISAASGFLSGTRWNPVKALSEAIEDSLPIMSILMGVGMFIQIMALNGSEGFVVVSALSLPSWGLLLGIMVAMPVFGAMSAYGSASVLGVPFLLALLDYNVIIVASALGMLASLGDLMPPGTLSPFFAAQALGIDDRFRIARHCFWPGLAVACWGVAMILLSNRIAHFLF